MRERHAVRDAGVNHRRRRPRLGLAWLGLGEAWLGLGEAWLGLGLASA